MKSFDLASWPGFPQCYRASAISTSIHHLTIDSRRIHSPSTLFVALPGKYSDGHDFVAQADQLGARFALVSKRWRPSAPLKQISFIPVDEPLIALQQIAHLYRLQCRAKVIAITGSHGKTMVKDLLHALLASTFKTAASPGSFNSQIGVPLSLFTVDDDHQYALIEAGVSCAGEMDKLSSLIAPDYAILTNIGSAHVPYFHNLETTAEEKMKLLYAVPKEGWALLPAHPLLVGNIAKTRCRPYFWNKADPYLPRISSLASQPTATMPYEIHFPDGFLYRGEIASGFSYLLEVITIAVQAAWLLEVPAKDIATVLQGYTPEPMRTEIWKAPQGPLYLNDSYCSDPFSVDLALKMLQLGTHHGRRLFLFGGFKDNAAAHTGNYRRVGQAIKQAAISQLHLYGGHDYTALLQEISPSTEVTHWKSLHDALSTLRHQLRPDDLVLVKGAHKEPLDNLIKIVNDSPNDNQYLINLSAIDHNIDILRSHLPSSTRLMVMVKASAYGSDALIIAKFLEKCGVDILGLSYADEAIALKKAGVTQDLFVLNAATYEASKIARWGLEVGVSDAGMIDALAQAATKEAIKVHLHVDTGMSRFGCRPKEAVELALRIKKQPSLILHGVMTHLASADDIAADTFTMDQKAKFRQVIDLLRKQNTLPPWIHAANSAGLLRFPFPECNMARIGLAIYGLLPYGTEEPSYPLRPALSLVSRIVGINSCKKGESVSYGRTYTVKEDMEKIAILPLGYYDGLHRHYSGKGSVIIRGEHAPMVGTICMDYMMVNVTHIPHAAVGDSALLFGEDEFGHTLSPTLLASQGASVLHELITCLGPRLPRVFLYQP